MADPVTIGIMLAATALQAKSQYDAGKAAKHAANAEAVQLESSARQKRIAAVQKQAAAQRNALGEIRKTDLALSRAQAVAAGSGGGSLDPGVANIIASLSGQGEFRKNAALYEGDAAARDLMYDAELDVWGAQVKRASGKEAEKAGKMKALTTTVMGVAGAAASPAGQSMFAKFGSSPDLVQGGALTSGGATGVWFPSP